MRGVPSRILGLVLAGLAVFFGAAAAGPAGAESLSFQVQVAAITPPSGMPALHSMAYAERHGYWVFLGGRTDGLHAPFGGSAGVPFSWANANKLVWVIQREQGKIWKISLPAQWRFILSAGNAQHHFDGRHGKLYVLGGYGASSDVPSNPKFTTFDTVVSLDVDGLIARLRQDFGNGGDVPDSVLAEFLRVRTGVPQARLTGGRLEHIPGEDRYYLFFGHDCVGRYCGGSGGFQKYSFEIRSFRIVETPQGPDLQDVQVLTTDAVPAKPPGCEAAPAGETFQSSGVRISRVDETVTRVEAADGNVFEIAEPADHDSQYRRRDLNAGPIRVPGPSPEGIAGVAAYGGVFTKKESYPYLNPVYVASGSAPVLDTFQQRLSQYETALLPIWDAVAQRMHTVFFGGLSLYVYKDGNFQCNLSVPFIPTISVLSRNAAGSQETVLPEGLPGLLGTNSAFLRNAKAEAHFYDNGVLNLGSLPPGEPVTVGFIVGGIEMTSKSAASNKILAVRIVRRPV